MPPRKPLCNRLHKLHTLQQTQRQPRREPGDAKCLKPACFKVSEGGMMRVRIASRMAKENRHASERTHASNNSACRCAMAEAENAVNISVRSKFWPAKTS